MLKTNSKKSTGLPSEMEEDILAYLACGARVALCLGTPHTLKPTRPRRVLGLRLWVLG